jgi:hypothetical protein
MHEERKHSPERKFTHSLGVPDTCIDTPVHRVFALGPHGFFPGVFDTAEHQIQRRDCDEYCDDR